MRFPHAFPRSFLAAIFVAVVMTTAYGAPASGSIARPKPHTGRLISSPAILRFGRVPIGSRNVQTIAITNLGDSSVTLFQSLIQGTPFTLSGLDLPLTLAKGESFTFSAVFAPRSRGEADGSISFVADASSTNASPILELGLKGTGTDAGRLIVDPPTLDFGKVEVGSAARLKGTLSVIGGPVTIESANISDPDFAFSGLSFPLTIPEGGRAEYTVTFAPQSSGAVSGTLAFQSDDQSLTVQGLTGTGIPSQNHSVDLSWNASSSKDVIGYNVYRGNVSGGPYKKINPVLDASTVYTDTNVSDGNTYYYVATAVDSSNQESVYSNETQATIPTNYAESRGSKRSPTSSRRTRNVVLARRR